MKLTFKRNAAGKAEFTDDDFCAIHAENTGPGRPNMALGVPRFVREAAVEKMQSLIRKARAANEHLTYKKAYDFVAAERPELAFINALDILEDSGDFDIEAEEKGA